MLEHFAPLILAIIIPIVLWILMVRTMRYLKLDWIKGPQLRIIWTGLLFGTLIYALCEPTVYGGIMKLNRNIPIWEGYLVAGFLGASIMCGFWYITGRAFDQLRKSPVSEGLFSQNFPGISLQALIKLNDVSANRRKYIFDFGRVNGSRLSVYISSDNVFTFSFIDAQGEPHPMQIPIGSSGIPFVKPFYIICELGIDGQTTLLRMLIDGAEIKSIQLPFKVDLGGIDVPGGVIGADLNGDNGASFEMGTMMIFRTTMMSSQIDVLTKMILDYYQSSERHFLSFNGNQWMRVNKVNFQEPVQKNNKLFILNDPNMAVKFADVERRPDIDSKDNVYALFQRETIVQINRVIADGGTIVDEQWMDTVIRTLKEQGIYSIQ